MDSRLKLLFASVLLFGTSAQAYQPTPGSTGYFIKNGGGYAATTTLDENISNTNGVTTSAANGFFASAFNGTGAADGFINLTATGTLPTAPSGSATAQLLAHGVTSSYLFELPTAPCSGFLTLTNTSGTMTSACTATFSGVPSVPASGYNELKSDAGGSAAWTARNPTDTAGSTYNSPANLQTGTTTTVLSTTIRAGEVQYGGALHISGSCKFSVAAAMTASTFTASLKYYNAANTTEYNIVTGNATPSVAAAASYTVTFSDYVLLAAPNSSSNQFSATAGAGIGLAGGTQIGSTVGLATSLLGNISSPLLSGTAVIVDSVAENQIRLEATTSVTNTTNNTAQCALSVTAFNP